MKNGLEGKYVLKNNKKLAFGYTTGSCAAAAAKAAAILLFTKQAPKVVKLMTPKGILLSLEVLQPELEQEQTEGRKGVQRIASCAIRKDAGDDPDVTHGVLVYAKLWLHDSVQEQNLEKNNRGKAQEITVCITGGIGVGRVTRPGLEQAVGEAAINRVPREMITEAVKEICEENDYHGTIHVEISIPQGVELAKKTFNPRLGIEGGISILGTSGIVEPMSEAALIASIRLEMQMHRNNGAEYLLVAPGNYGTAYLTTHLPFTMEQAVKCSNFVGETIDMAVELGYKGILFVSHIGKFIKVAGGIMNTHSRNADARMELLAANALLAGADNDIVRQILQAVTTDEGIAILKDYDLLEPTMQHVMEKIHYYLDHRAYGNLQLGAIIFSNEQGELGKAGPVEELIQELMNTGRKI